MTDSPEREQAEALRTPEQMEWIRDRYRPDGLRRLARADRDYADAHGYYLPDVAALAYAEWERAEKAERAAQEMNEAQFRANVKVTDLREQLAAAVERERELTRALDRIEKGRPGRDVEVMRWMQEVAREALAGGVSAAGRPPEQDLGGNAVAVAEARLYVYWCRECQMQTERAWHSIKGVPLIPQTDVEHQCEEIEVVPIEVAARQLIEARGGALTAATALQRSHQEVDPVVPAAPEVLPEETR